MSASRKGACLPALSACAASVVALMLSLAVAGCGPATMAEMTSEQLADTYARILDARYDDVFPDDRVQTVRITMADADWQAMQRDLVGKVFDGDRI